MKIVYLCLSKLILRQNISLAILPFELTFLSFLFFWLSPLSIPLFCIYPFLMTLDSIFSACIPSSSIGTRASFVLDQLVSKLHPVLHHIISVKVGRWERTWKRNLKLSTFKEKNHCSHFSFQFGWDSYWTHFLLALEKREREVMLDTWLNFENGILVGKVACPQWINGCSQFPPFFHFFL